MDPEKERGLIQLVTELKEIKTECEIAFLRKEVDVRMSFGLLAQKIGVYVRTIHRWFNGYRQYNYSGESFKNPQLRNIEKIEKFISKYKEAKAKGRLRQFLQS